jgi:hypothetical protein
MSVEEFVSSIEDHRLRLVARHWSEIRGRHVMPAWRDIDPTRIGASLPILFVWSYDRHSGQFMCRLAGEEIIERFGKNPRRKSFDEYFTAEGGQVLRRQWEKIVRTPSLARSTGRVYQERYGRGSGERIVMPLAGDGVHADGLIGATAFSGAIGEMVSAPCGEETIEFFPIAPA